MDPETVVEVTEQAVPTETQKLEDAVQQVLRDSLEKDCLVRGHRECIKALDRGKAVLCFMPSDCDQEDYIKLVRALCTQNKIPFVIAGTRKRLGEWSGQSKQDRDGNPRKVVGCSLAVIKQWGKESEARNYLVETLNKA